MQSSPATGGFSVSNAYRYYVLALLVTVGVCSWVDRQIFSVLLQGIKQEFSFTDTQLGLLLATSSEAPVEDGDLEHPRNRGTKVILGRDLLVVDAGRESVGQVWPPVGTSDSDLRLGRTLFCFRLCQLRPLLNI